MSSKPAASDPMEPSVDSASPLYVALDNDFPVVVAGLAEVLRPYAARVRLLPPTAAIAGADLILYDTFGATARLQEYVAAATAKVVVFTHVTDAAAVVEAVRSGVAGYVYKGVSADTLVDTLIDVHHASTPVLALDTSPTPPGETRAWPGRASHLTEREAEILSLVCRGLSNKDIAAQLFLSINSVKTYLRLAYRKIGVDSRTKALLWGLEHGLVGGT